MTPPMSVEPTRSPPHVHLGGYENIQYLSRDHFHYPGPPDTELGSDTPDEAIQRAVKGQWDNYIQKKPLTRSDGKTVHDIVNLNSVQILYNRMDERPCTLTGHLYSHLVQTPSSATTIWPLEVPYPSDERIKEVMNQFTPLDQHNDCDNPTDPVAAEPPRAADVQIPSPVESMVDSPPTLPVIFEQKLSPHCGYCRRAPHPSVSCRPATPYPGHSVRPVDTILRHTENILPELEEGEVNDTSHAIERTDSPDSLPSLVSISSRNHNNIPLEYRSGKPCTACNGPPHQCINDCPAWYLPHREPPDSAFEVDKSSTASNSVETTPKTEQLQLNPAPFDESQIPMPSIRVPRSDLVIQNLRQLLGVDPTAPEHLAKMRDLARATELQAHEAWELFSRNDASGENLEAFNLTLGIGIAASSEQSVSFSNAATDRPSSPGIAPEIRAPLIGPALLDDEDLNTPSFGSLDVQYSDGSAFSTTFSTEPETERSDDDSTSTDTNKFLATVAETTGFPPIFQNFDGANQTMGAELFHWVERQMERVEFTRCWNSDFGAEPWQNARALAFGTLHHLLDHTRMVTNNLHELGHEVSAYTALYGTLPSNDSRSANTVSDTTPDPTQSTTALDFSLPSASQQVPSPPPSLDERVDSNGPPDDANTGRGKKRKPGRSGASTAEQPRKRFRKFLGDSLRRAAIHQAAFKATHLTKPGVLGRLAFIRRNLLEGAQRL
ncbi:hypothetical protein DFH09DRAFT_1067426 [Mycena vulgaris]|nr:hypothetical protein DFH09DRAFT_1067426 [Mycena vulgaris]